MAGKTISAYADEETARLVAELAQAERRTPSQIAAEAISLYVRLPREAHATLREIGGDAETQAAMFRHVTRAILRVAYDASLERFAPSVREIYGDSLQGEDEILAEAARLTSPKDRSRGRRSGREVRPEAADAETPVIRQRAS